MLNNAKNEWRLLFQRRLGLPIMVYFLSRSVNMVFLFSHWNKGINRVSVLGFAFVSTIFLSQCGLAASRNCENWSTLFSFISYPIRWLRGIWADFRPIFHHSPDLHPVSFLSPRLCSMALEQIRRGLVRRLVDVRCRFRFCSDKLHQRNWNGRLLWGDYLGATYSGSFHNKLFQPHHRLPRDYFWCLQEHYRRGFDLAGLYPTYAWEEFTNIFEGIVTWQPSVLYVSLFIFLTTRKLFVDCSNLESLWELLYLP